MAQGEIHVASVNDIDTPPECLTDQALCMFSRTFQALTYVNDSIGRVGNKLLEAEIRGLVYALKLTKVGMTLPATTFVQLCSHHEK